MHRSEMQVLSVNFWSCSPISVHAQGARSWRFGRLSRSNECADRGRAHQPALSTSSVQAAASAHRCDHALAFCTPSARVQLRRVERRRRDRRPLGAPRREGDGRQLFPWRRLIACCGAGHWAWPKDGPLLAPPSPCPPLSCHVLSQDESRQIFEIHSDKFWDWTVASLNLYHIPLPHPSAFTTPSPVYYPRENF